MDRRELLGGLGVAAGLAAFGVANASAADDKTEHHHHLDQVHEDCLKACGECAVTCNMMAHHCLEELCEGRGPAKLHAKAHSLADDCQAFCVLSAQMIARSSDLMIHSCAACAEACRCCAEECEKAKDDATMMRCAQKCRDCERSCRAMVQSMKAKAAASIGVR
jgi:hypothetical protein